MARSTRKSTSNTPGKAPTTQPTPTSNTVKRSGGPTKPTDTTPTSEPLAEQPEKSDEKPRL